MQVKEAFGENADRNDATGQNWPHQQTALLNIINHANFSRPLCRKCKSSWKSGLARPLRRENPVTSAAYFFRFDLGCQRLCHQPVAVYIKDRITSSLTCLIVAVNNLWRRSRSLRFEFFLQTTRAIVFVAALKTKMAIRPENRAAGKRPASSMS